VFDSIVHTTHAGELSVILTLYISEVGSLSSHLTLVGKVNKNRARQSQSSPIEIISICQETHERLEQDIRAGR